jgi:hypothetical protein
MRPDPVQAVVTVTGHEAATSSARQKLVAFKKYISVTDFFLSTWWNHVGSFDKPLQYQLLTFRSCNVPMRCLTARDGQHGIARFATGTTFANASGHDAIRHVLSGFGPDAVLSSRHA